jgi:hypothetical protein
MTSLTKSLFVVIGSFGIQSYSTREGRGGGEGRERWRGGKGEVRWREGRGEVEGREGRGEVEGREGGRGRRGEGKVREGK